MEIIMVTALIYILCERGTVKTWCFSVLSLVLIEAGMVSAYVEPSDWRFWIGRLSIASGIAILYHIFLEDTLIVKWGRADRDKKKSDNKS